LPGAAGRRSTRFGAAGDHPVCSLPIVDFGEQRRLAPAGITEIIVVVLPHGRREWSLSCSNMLVVSALTEFGSGDDLVVRGVSC